MCQNDAGPGSGGLKGSAIFVLILAILHMDVLCIILASIVVCSCCGPSNKNKTCIVVFTSIVLALELIGAIAGFAIGAGWISAASECRDGMKCYSGHCPLFGDCPSGDNYVSRRLDPVATSVMAPLINPAEHSVANMPMPQEQFAAMSLTAAGVASHLLPRLTMPITSLLRSKYGEGGGEHEAAIASLKKYLIAAMRSAKNGGKPARQLDSHDDHWGWGNSHDDHTATQCCVYDTQSGTECDDSDLASDIADFVCGFIHTIGMVIIIMVGVSSMTMVLGLVLMLVFSCKLQPDIKGPGAGPPPVSV